MISTDPRANMKTRVGSRYQRSFKWLVTAGIIFSSLLSWSTFVFAAVKFEKQIELLGKDITTTNASYYAPTERIPFAYSSASFSGTVTVAR